MVDTQHDEPLRLIADPIITRRRGPRIGLLISQLNRSFHRTALMTVSNVARSFGASFVCFDGDVLAPALAGRSSDAAKANILYDLVGPDALDGVIIWSSALDWDVGEAAMNSFCRRFAALPVVSVGRAFDRIPSVLVDNYQGMRAAVSHLVQHHGHRRVAFLRGPDGAHEADLRYRAYCEVLVAHGIPVAPELVSGPTNWERSDGARAVQELLDRRRLQVGDGVQAIVSVGDDMACGVLETLQARGICVPDEMAVVGFNDDDEGRAILPSLTTVRQPVDAMARAAVTTLLALLDGRAVPDVVTLPLDLVVRRSCGCLSPGVLQAAAQRNVSGEPLAERLAALSGLEVTAAGQLVNDFLSDATATEANARGAFVTALNTLLQRDALANHDVSRWQGVLSAMRDQMLAVLPATTIPAAENLWQQARVLVGETAVQVRVYQRFRAEQDSRRLGDFSRRIQTASDRNALLDTLASELPGFGFSTCYLVLYEGQGPLGPASLVFAFNAGGRLDLSAVQVAFPAPQLLPAGILPDDVLHSLVALPLFFQARQLGFMLLSMDARGTAFSETFREQISGALAGLFLREDIRRAWQGAEEANRLKSRFLATVSHELRTPLSLIVGTIEMLQREGAAAQVERSDTYRKDLERIQASAQHLSRLIGDVLDLASSQVGELRLAYEPLHLNVLLNKVAALGESLAAEKGLVWACEVPQGLPLVWGDRTRLQQVLLNLISNAVKFTSQGFITLWAEKGRNQVMVAVSDTGMGIPPDEQEFIFDEFRQTERSAQRGYGGMGLGLAVSKRLVELHHGQIGVISSGADGTGSTFFFTLPILQGAEEIQTLGDSRADVVLLLTEDAASGSRVRQHLTHRGYEVEMLTIDATTDWLTHVLMAPPGAIMLDVEPAAEQGWELMQALKLNPATCDIPVIFYSLSAAGDAGSLLLLDYLGKPVSEEALAQALERQGMVGHLKKRAAILVVEDDPGIQALHARIVRARVPGCRVIYANNGAEALEIMSTLTPDLVLLDLMMPQVDGFAVLEQMRQGRRTRNVPVIVLTAQLLTGAEMTRLQQGVVAVLRKELFSESEVLTQVEAALAHSKRLGSEAQRIARLAMAQIHEHYAKAMPREALAASVGVSERYLTRCFKQETGITPVAYLNRYRIRQACRLLDAGHLSITEVALAVGFSDSGYFSRVFRDEIGLSPKPYQGGQRPAEPDTVTSSRAEALYSA